MCAFVRTNLVEHGSTATREKVRMQQIKINGELRNIDADPQMPLLWAIRDIVGLKFVDVGHGWLIFALPPAEIAVRK